MAKRQRTPKQLFEQGVNPPGEARPSKKRKALPKNPSLTRSTPKTGRRGALQHAHRGLPSPPATNPPRRSPLFEPELPYTQSALLEQADDLVDGEDDDIEEEEADPLPEGDTEDEAEGGGGVEDALEAEDGEPSYRREVATPFMPRSSEMPEEPDPIVNVRWRACFGDMEKNPIPTAFNSKQDQYFFDLYAESLWEWVDEVVSELKPRRVKPSSLCAVVYPSRQPKRDRAIKTLRRGRDGEWNSLLMLVTAIDRDSNDRVRVDFDLMLVEELNEAPQAAVQGAGGRARPVTATMIQESGIADALAAEQAGSGMALGIRDRWRCIDGHCKNHPYTCWLKPGQQARFENHYPVNGNIIAMWARDISKQLATYDEPSDNVKLAIMRAKDRAQHEKSNRRRSPNSGDDDIKSLTKLLIVGQLKQMNRQPLGELNLQSARVNQRKTPSPVSQEWVPIKYDHAQEITEHTINFFESFKAKFIIEHELIQNIFDTVVINGAMDLNMLMGESENNLKLWVDHFNLPPGWFFTLQQHAVEWQNSYNGLSERSWRRVERCRKREEKIRKTIGAERSSSTVSSSDR